MYQKLKFALLFSVLAASAIPAQAHRAWILPGATVLSSEDPWVTFDAAISNDIFHADYHAMALDNVKATAPDGSNLPLQNTHTGKYRSNFDLQLSQKGTYKIASTSNGLMASWEQDGERKRWRGKLDNFKKEVPQGASKLEVTEISRRIETFVTAGEPTKTVFKSKGDRGLTLVPQTHPNDLYAGEKATFQLFIDGKPAKRAEVEIVPGGMRYRDQQNSMAVTADDKGNIVITWPQAGLYWLNGSYEDNNSDISIDNTKVRRRASYTATFEVLPL